MRAMWTKYGRLQSDFAPARPYTLDDLRTTLGEVTSAAFADDFFARYVRGRDVVDYETLLAGAGLVLRQASDAASFGAIQLRADDGRLLVVGTPAIGSPAYEAGLDRGDVLVSVNGVALASPQDLRQHVDTKRPGDRIAVAFEHRGIARTATVVLQADERLEIVPFEAAGRPVTDAIRQFRAAWVGSRR
jgi:predicted metalloprotease with PDZ domain